MTFKPTKRRQQRWIKDYLNGGVCAETRDADHKTRYTRPAGAPMYACYEALEWLASTDIKTLAEAWDQCQRPDWMFWMLCRMGPTDEDSQLTMALYKELAECEWLPPSVAVEVKGVLRKAKSLNIPISLHGTAGMFNWACTSCIGGNQPIINSQKQARVADLIRKVFGNPWKVK
jgi:hypothetical protein